MSALIVARPGPVRDALRAALRSVPHLDHLVEVDAATSALTLALEPLIILVSTDATADQPFVGLEELRARWPGVHCVLLVDSVDQRRAARSAGIDRVLVKGVRPEALLQVVESAVRSAVDGNGQRWR